MTIMKAKEFTKELKEESLQTKLTDKTSISRKPPRNPMTETECECICCYYRSTCKGVCGDFHSNR